MAQSKQDLQRQYNQKQAQIRQYQNSNRSIDGQISVLQWAYNRLRNECCPQAKEVETKVKKAKDGFDWRGTFKDSYDSIVDDELKRYAEDTYDSIQKLMAEINNKKCELQNKKNENEGIIGYLKSGCNYIYTQIQNWVD